jgi:hypothetical protein
MGALCSTLSCGPRQAPSWATPLARLAPVVHPRMDACAWIPGKQKLDPTPIANPSAHNSFLHSLFHSCRSDRDPPMSKREGRRCRRGPLRRCTHPPMGGCAAVERLLGGALPARAHTAGSGLGLYRDTAPRAMVRTARLSA